MSTNSGFQFSDYRVVVGIDFGTTYSGAAYGILSAEDVNDINTWPKQSNVRYPKAPTLSLYNGDTKTLAAWGNAARIERNKATAKSNYLWLQQYKLYLDDSLNGVFRPLPGGFKPIEVIADYLREFHDHVLSEMKKGFAQQFDDSRYRYCLTVPAMWSDRSKQAMRDAAILAGLIRENDDQDRLMLISEPEAAAIYCEKTCEQFNMRDGDEFMICDAGGGTVDLIVFSVSLDADGNRRFKESTKGLGKSCGSAFVDKKMRKLLRSKLKSVVDPVPPAALETMMEHFTDSLKPSFDGTEDLFLTVPMSAGLKQHTDESIGLEAGLLTLPVEELSKKVFDPVIQEILGLIYKQKQQTTNLKAIFLVGGFGASQYLHLRISEEFKKHGIQVVIPHRPELAVVRGAVYFGMNPRKVTTRVPRYWYGIDITNTFEEGIDPPEYKIVRPDGSVRCDNRFSVFVRRGEPLDIDSCVTQKYTTFYPRHTQCTFFAASTEEQPRYTLQPGVKKVFDFEIPMPHLPDALPGDTIDLTIKMYFGEVELRVEAIIREQAYRVVCNFNV
ncbi:hypothetical protein BCR43DRAFT_483818 [Syncephalastrum racemosum]|uniref:Actin-like ATPase domain-containing protein n=1 Tax=Syncephalastrum racemosum TaxID=13706 RepID=A0A1X2HVW0_SYNRA|nr:hypothetical protein BCR43DRAFT_483818 [Syncephalastrum racemosum]